MKIFFYSNKCIKCKKLWKIMKEKNLSDKYKTICVDNNNNLPNNITEVPTIVDSSLSNVLVGDKAFDYIASLQFFNFPSNNYNNWNNQIVPKPVIQEDKKAYDETAMQNSNQKFNNSKEVEKMKNIRREQDLFFRKMFTK